MSGGGGSTSGAIDFPEHMKDVHMNWLGVNSGTGLNVPITAGNSLNDLINNALDNNPYASATLSTPDASVNAIKNEITALKNSIGNIDAKTDWKGFLDHADSALRESNVLKNIDVTTILENARVNANLTTEQAVSAALATINSSVIKDARKAFENRSDRTRIRSINRFSGGMLDINAVNGSAFILGMALIEAQHIESVNEFDTNLSTEMYTRGLQVFAQTFNSELSARIQSELENKRYNASIISQSIQSMTSTMLKRIDFEQAVLSILYETERFNVVATQEYETSDIDIDVKYANWGFDNYIKASNVLASISGASAVLPEKPNRVSSALGGALGGASAGSALGPPGMAAGAILGGVAGLLG